MRSGLSGVFVFGEPFSWVQWAGFSVLVAGIAIFSMGRLATVRELAGSEQHVYGNAMIALSALTWAVYGVAQKQLLRVLPSQHIMLCIYVGCAGLFALLAEPRSLLELDALGAGLLAFAAFNTIVAYGAFSEALEHWEASRVSAVLALTPIATLAFSELVEAWWPTFLDSPELSWGALGGACLVVAGSLTTALGAEGGLTQSAAGARTDDR